MPFSTAQQVKHHVESLLPDEGVRRLYLSIFAESAARLNSLGADLWGAYSTNQRVRLLGGQLIVLALERRGIWLALDGFSLDAVREFEQRVDTLTTWTWDESDTPEYVPVPSRNGYFLPRDEHLKDWRPIRELHFRFLDRVAHKYRRLNSTSQGKHQPALLEYIESELGRGIPTPSYDTLHGSRKSPDVLTLPEEVVESQKLYEGARLPILVNAYERNPKARQLCIDHYKAICCVCGFDFAARYGDCAAGLIHVHHLKPLADIGEEYEIDPITDLRPVCPNCHAVIHRRSPPYSIEEVRGFIARH